MAEALAWTASFCSLRTLFLNLIFFRLMNELSILIPLTLGFLAFLAASCLQIESTYVIARYSRLFFSWEALGTVAFGVARVVTYLRPLRDFPLVPLLLASFQFALNKTVPDLVDCLSFSSIRL
jgi:hypothetical protein